MQLLSYSAQLLLLDRLLKYFFILYGYCTHCRLQVCPFSIKKSAKMSVVFLYLVAYLSFYHEKAIKALYELA